MMSLWLLVTGAAHATPMLGITLSPVPLNLGDTLTVTITAEDIPAPGLLGFGFTLLFDPSVFTAAVPVIGSFWTGPTDVAVGPGSAGATASLGSGSGSTAPSGFGISLATIMLTVVGPAPATQLSLGHFLTSGENLLDDGVVLDDGSIPGFLSATATVPEPQLIGLGLLACLGFRTRGSAVRS